MVVMCDRAADCWVAHLHMKMTAARSMSVHTATNLPTSHDLGEALLSAAASGNRSKLKKLIDTGSFVRSFVRLLSLTRIDTCLLFSWQYSRSCCSAVANIPYRLRFNVVASRSTSDSVTVAYDWGVRIVQCIQGPCRNLFCTNCRIEWCRFMCSRTEDKTSIRINAERLEPCFVCEITDTVACQFSVQFSREHIRVKVEPTTNGLHNPPPAKN